MQPHLVPRQVMVDRPISEMNKQITGPPVSFKFCGLVSQVGKSRRGVSSPKSPVILKDLGAGWEIVVQIPPLPPGS